MEFQITLGQHGPDLAAIQRILVAADPAAVMDQDPAGGQLRVATVLDGQALLMALHRAGWPVDPSQLQPVPSNCCGGCGG